jgi:hypothetical protein
MGSIKNLRLFIYILLFCKIVLLHGQSVHFQNYKTLKGRPFTLHKDLVTENLPPESSGLIYNEINKDNFDLSNSMGGDSFAPWTGAVCYFPPALWNNTQEKIIFAQNDDNWILLESQSGGQFLGSNYLFHSTEKSILNETLGIWYLHPEEMPDRDGNWWNAGDGVSKTEKIYYIKLR